MDSIKVISQIPDYRIKAVNIAVEMSTRDYISIASEIIDENEFQRKRVISSRLKKTLKSDIKQRCTIPPIVLGVRDNYVPEDFNFEKFNNDEFVKDVLVNKNVIILDGLQRTYVLLELVEEYDDGEWLDQHIRCEVYIGVEKLGILYRMLTLNTGQTTMSTRHLLEILFYDYLKIEIKDQIKLFLDKDEVKITDPLNQYKFKDIIEGYNSFINGREVPIARADILQNIDTLDSLERTEDEKEGFKQFLILFNKILTIHEAKSDFQFDKSEVSSEFQIESNPFGKSTLEIFGKSQSLTGLGSALHFLKKFRDTSFSQIEEYTDKLKLTDPESFYKLLKNFDLIRNKSKKVGNDQRFFFKIYYRFLFDEDRDSFLDISKSIEDAIIRVEERLEE